VGTNERRLHAQLKIIAGRAAGRRLVSARGAQTRPMMEKVRAAIFDMVQAQAGSVGGLPSGSRWLDLFAGTGSVGLEALSRGAAEAHFVELDPWVHRRVLGRNIAACGFGSHSTCHTSRAEDFLKRAAAAPRFAGGPFDFISVCPPYLLVSYPELYDLLEASGLVHAGSVVFVEYPKQLAQHVRPTLGPLTKVRDRKYGRTWVAIYAPHDGGKGAMGSSSRGGASSGDGSDSSSKGGGGSGGHIVADGGKSTSAIGADWGV
jgi:16S rRNA (guanine(966)-N(2))-methyltransferase RsmD